MSNLKKNLFVKKVVSHSLRSDAEMQNLFYNYHQSPDNEWFELLLECGHIETQSVISNSHKKTTPFSRIKCEKCASLSKRK